MTAVPSDRPFEQVRSIIQTFADENHFAAQPLISKPQGAAEFSVRLFRDDVSLLVTKLRDGPIQITAYPLCACDLDKRAGLQTAGKVATADLKERLSR
jgi:hypothetical protein